MELNEELTRKLTKALGSMKSKYDALKERREKLKKSISETKTNNEELSREFQTLSTIYPVETEKSLRQNMILKYKLKKIKQNKEHDLNQLFDLQDITEKSISQLALERSKHKKIKEKKHAALEDLQQISEIVQYLKSMPTNEQIASQTEYKLKGVMKHNESERQQLISTLYSLKQEFDKIDDTIRSLQLKLSSKIRDISEFEEKISNKDEIVSDLTFQIDELYNKSEYLNQQYDEKVLECDELQSTIKNDINNIQLMDEERENLSKLIQKKQKKYLNLKTELKKYCNVVANCLNNETLKSESDLNSREKSINQVISEKDAAINNLQNQIQKVKMETAEIIIQQEKIQNEINEEKEKLYKYKIGMAEKLQSMQAVITSLTSNIIGNLD